MDIIIISIGTLSKNPLWGEKTPVRASHATTTLIRSKEKVILVDPSLPANLLQTLLFDRTGLQPSAVNAIFLTNWRPVHRRGLELFSKAQWFMHETERETAQQMLTEASARTRNAGQTAEDPLIISERNLLARIQNAPDELAENVDLFPLPGYTAGQCGLLISQATQTTIIAGDAVPTAGHFLAGQVFQESYDLEQAKASLSEMYEIADMIVPGHDNIFRSPR